jgi:ubiquinone/menaquinone biosynthesis C-methylase UbiE
MKKIDKTMIAVKTYSKIAKDYAREFFNDKIDLKHLNKFLLMLPKRARILDVGCGPGNYTKCMMEKGFVVEGIDLSKGMIKVARKMVPKGIFKIMDMRQLHYSAQTFDGLCAAYSLYHIASDQALDVLREFHRVLKPDGIMILMLQQGKGEGIIPEPFDEKEKMFFKYYQKNEIKKLLKATNFEVMYEAERKSRGELELKQKKLFISLLQGKNKYHFQYFFVRTKFFSAVSIS